MKDKTKYRLIGLLYAAVIVALAAMFFTNDFGLVDLRKTSVVIGVGIDLEGDEVQLCAQLALPQPAENGENTQYSTVKGSGKTVASALNDVNVKTGFYPKLVFCKLVLIGESCFNRDVNALLNYFYDNEYTELTPKIAACRGKAGDMLSLSLPFGDCTTDFIERILSDEAQKSGNVSAADLNAVGQGYMSKSGASHMPFIECFKGGGQGETDGSAGGLEGGTEGGGQQGGSGGGSQQGGEEIEFLCNRTAVFDRGYFKGVLDEEQSFAFNLLNNEVRHAFIGCDGENSVLGLRSCSGSTELKIDGGIPVLKLSFSAAAKLMDDADGRPGGSRPSTHTPEELLKSGEETISGGLESLFKFCKESGCDVLGAVDLLYKRNYKYFDTFKDVLYDRINLVCDVKLKSVS